MEMFAMLRQSLQSDGNNPILNKFELGSHVASGGPEMVWKIYDAVRKNDLKEMSVFVFDKKVADKLYKSKRREAVCDVLRRDVELLIKYRHPKMLQVVHPLEECHDSLAFASEPILASLSNLLGTMDRMPTTLSNEIKNHEFLEVEIKAGILQVAEALAFLHGSEQTLHGNVSPHSIFITKTGTWKLAGLGFAQTNSNCKSNDNFKRAPWNSKVSKMIQPPLDYTAPEIQLGKQVSFLSDMFSLGMVICAIYNDGKSLFDSNNNVQTYMKKADHMSQLFGAIAGKIPLPLVEPVEKMINQDTRYRPTAQLFTLLKYFQDPVVACIHFIGALEQKHLDDKREFFSSILVDLIPNVPNKILFKHIVPCLLSELDSEDMVGFVLPSVISVIEHSSTEQYRCHIHDTFIKRIAESKSTQVSTMILGELNVITAKLPADEVTRVILPLVLNTLESNIAQEQDCAIRGIFALLNIVDKEVVQKSVLPKLKSIFPRAIPEVQVNVLTSINSLLDFFERSVILDEVLPFLAEIQVQDAFVLTALLEIYKQLLSDKRYGLNYNLLATKVIPSLVPHSMLQGLTAEQLCTLMTVLREMLSIVERQRRNKMDIDQLTVVQLSPSSEKRHSVTGCEPEYEKLRNSSPTRRTLNVGISGRDSPTLKSRTAPNTPEAHNMQRHRFSAGSLTTMQARNRKHSAASSIFFRRDSSPVISCTSSSAEGIELLAQGPSRPAINLVPDSSKHRTLYKRFSKDSLMDREEIMRRYSDGQTGGTCRRPSIQSFCSDESPVREVGRRYSTQSCGAVIFQNVEQQRKDSRTLNFLDTITPTIKLRTSSFGESMMQFFSNKPSTS